MQASAEVEAKPVAPEFSRVQLDQLLYALDASLHDVSVGMVAQEQQRTYMESRPMPSIQTARDALFYTLESIDQRLLNLLYPLSAREKDKPSELEQAVPYYRALIEKGSKIVPFIDDGAGRTQRHSLLERGLRRKIDAIEQNLDMMERQRTGRGRLAALAIYPTYMHTFGAIESTPQYLRPWHHGPTLDQLSEPGESDITPLPDISEIDEVEG